MASDFVPEGILEISKGGFTSSPSQEYLAGIEPLFTKLVLVIINPELLEKDVIATAVAAADKVLSKYIKLFLKKIEKIIPLISFFQKNTERQLKLLTI
jgi:hypothetical protein